MSEGKQKMIVKTYSTTLELWQAAKEKAEKNAQTLSAVIRRLLEKWLKGEVNLDN